MCFETDVHKASRFAPNEDLFMQALTDNALMASEIPLDSFLAGPPSQPTRLFCITRAGR